MAAPDPALQEALAEARASLDAVERRVHETVPAVLLDANAQLLAILEDLFRDESAASTNGLAVRRFRDDVVSVGPLLTPASVLLEETVVDSSFAIPPYRLSVRGRTNDDLLFSARFDADAYFPASPGGRSDPDAILATINRYKPVFRSAEDRLNAVGNIAPIGSLLGDAMRGRETYGAVIGRILASEEGSWRIRYDPSHRHAIEVVLDEGRVGFSNYVFPDDGLPAIRAKHFNGPNPKRFRAARFQAALERHYPSTNVYVAEDCYGLGEEVLSRHMTEMAARDLRPGSGERGCGCADFVVDDLRISFLHLVKSFSLTAAPKR